MKKIFLALIISVAFTGCSKQSEHVSSIEQEEQLEEIQDEIQLEYDNDTSETLPQKAPEPENIYDEDAGTADISEMEPLPEIIEAAADSRLLQIGDVIIQLPISVAQLNDLGFEVSFENEEMNNKVDFRSNQVLEVRKNGLLYLTTVFNEHNLERIDYTAFGKPLNEIADKIFICTIYEGYAGDIRLDLNKGEVPIYYPGGFKVDSPWMEVKHIPQIEPYAPGTSINIKKVEPGLYEFSVVAYYDADRGMFSKLIYDVAIYANVDILATFGGNSNASVQEVPEQADTTVITDDELIKRAADFYTKNNGIAPLAVYIEEKSAGEINIYLGSDTGKLDNYFIYEDSLKGTNNIGELIDLSEPIE